MKILNLYAGIGGNRKLWPEGHEITAIEIDPKIAKIYQDFFPKDKVMVADAHQYLLEHFKEFDFIWSSPPCPSHSRIRNLAGVGCGQNEPIYPDMKLYEEILFLEHISYSAFGGVRWSGKYVVENVISYYKPLVIPQEINKHYFWANFYINKITIKSRLHNSGGHKALEIFKGFNLDNYNGIDKRLLLRNCVEPETGLHIFNCAFGRLQQGKIL